MQLSQLLMKRSACCCCAVQGQLRGRTFSAPRKSMRGKGRITVQFGCCYNYAVDTAGRKPGAVASSHAVSPPAAAALDFCMHPFFPWQPRGQLSL